MLRRFSRDLLLDVGLLLIRGMLGTVFVFHGGQKLFGWWDGSGLAEFAGTLQHLSMPYPAYGAVLAGGAEFFGGMALVTGLCMRLAIIPLIATMAVAILFVHPQTFSAQAQGMEYPLTLAVVLLSLLFMGPGRLAVTSIPIPNWFARRRTVHTLGEPSLL